MDDSPSNGWQNIGIMYLYALDNIPAIYRDTFMAIVRNSFGYRKKDTSYKPQEFLSKKIGIPRSKFQRHMTYLIDNHHIKVIRKHEYVDGGGKNPYSYQPVYPDKGFISLKNGNKVKVDNAQKENASKGW